MQRTIDAEIPFKVCTRCEASLPATREYFTPNRLGHLGLQSACKRCIRERQRAYRSTHREHIKALTAARRLPLALVPDTKMCTKCQKIFPLDILHFHRHSSTRDGYACQCRQCVHRYKRLIYGTKTRKASFVRRVRVSPLLPLKYCRWCNTIYARTTTFFPRSKQGRDGLDYVCKACRKRYHEKWYARGKELRHA